MISEISLHINGGEFIGFFKLVSENVLLGIFLSHGNSKFIYKLSVGKLGGKLPSWGKIKLKRMLKSYVVIGSYKVVQVANS